MNKLICCDCHKESPIPPNPYHLRRCTACKSVRTLFTKPPPIKLPGRHPMSWYGIDRPAYLP